MKLKRIVFTVFICMALAGCTQANEQPTPPSISPQVDVAQPVSDSAHDTASMDLLEPSELMIFVEPILTSIEDERGLERNNLLEYSMGYQVEYRNNGDTIVYTLNHSPGALLYIIIDRNTKDYFYFDAPEAYTMYGFDDKEVRFSCRTGEMAMQFRNFPFYMTYNIDEDSWHKTHLPINDTNYYDMFDGVPESFGVLDRIELSDEKARLVFSFDELLMKNPSLGSTLPITYYSFDPITQKATLSFSGIGVGNDKLVAQLQQLKGISQIDIKQTDLVDGQAKDKEMTKATQINFTVGGEFNLYAERGNTDWDGVAFMENNEMSFWLWTEKRM